MNNNKKPISLIGSKGEFYKNNEYAQNLLLKAMSEGVTDPKELQKAAGLSRVADVYRSLDKLAIRKEYHDALVRNNIDLDYIVQGYKTVIDTTAKDETKLKGLDSLLKSIGLDKYEKQEEASKNWEEEIMKAADKAVEDNKNMIEGEIVTEHKRYEVNAPQIPKEEMERQKEERRLGRDLYE